MPSIPGLWGWKRTVVALPIAWTGAWLVYYAYTDTIRRSHIRDRNKELQDTLKVLPEGYSSLAPTDLEKEALKRRYASLRYAGRYWNPYIEWREQGAWEWAFWKVVLSTLTLKLFYNGGLPLHRPINDLPIEKPNFELLFGPSALKQSGRLSKEQMIDLRDDKGKELSDVEKGEGYVRRNREGGEDVDVTDKLTLTWLGQSTSYVTLDNLTILTDPALSDRTLPSRLAPQRLRPPPCSLSDLKRIDVVLVSHNHFDHLDPEAVKELGDSCEWVVPIGVGSFLRELGVTRVTELDWWQETQHVLRRPGQVEKRYTITAVPLMHWSARSPLDTNATLWAGFHVKSHSSSPKSFIHLGDTGFSPTLFTAVGRVLGPIDLAAIPIGSYEPRWHLHLQHTDPEGATRMVMQMGVKRAVGVHWGTWLMSDEAYNQPPIDLAKARQLLGVSEETFRVLPVGQTMVVE